MVRGHGCRLVNCAVFGDVVREQVRQSGKEIDGQRVGEKKQNMRVGERDEEIEGMLSSVAVCMWRRASNGGTGVRQ